MVRTSIVPLLVLLFLGGCLTSCDSSPQLLDQTDRFPSWLIGPLIAISTFTSEDLACIGAGILSSNGAIPWISACFWCWLGLLVGDVGLYLIGRTFGPRIATRRYFRRILSAQRLRRAGDLFSKHGAWVLFTTRFLPGSRMPIYVGAGVVSYPLPKFALYLGCAGLLWTPLIVGVAYIWGELASSWMAAYERYAILAVVIAIAATLLTVKVLFPLATRRGRKLTLSRWHRFWEWEFWPPSLFYPPLLPYLLWLSFRFRSLTVFTAANPGMPHGGFVRESKSEILAGLEQREQNRSVIAAWTLLESTTADRMPLLSSFQQQLPEAFPIVLKPDVGERGRDVAIIRSAQEAEAYFATHSSAIIAQQYVPGLEFGVFYYRYPPETRGEIFSITQKHLLSIKGDGRTTLEELILQHPRGLRMASFFFSAHEDKLDWVPEEGERFFLGELGTHARGAHFTDGRDLKTEALRRAMDDISRGYPGFYFGRYDLRVPSVDDLRSGRNLQILELNGVSAEATHIYEPGYPLLLAYRDLAEQWRIAYEIGALNQKEGKQATSGRELASLVAEHFRGLQRKNQSPTG